MTEHIVRTRQLFLGEVLFLELHQFPRLNGVTRSIQIRGGDWNMRERNTLKQLIVGKRFVILRITILKVKVFQPMRFILIQTATCELSIPICRKLYSKLISTNSNIELCIVKHPFYSSIFRASKFRRHIWHRHLIRRQNTSHIAHMIQRYVTGLTTWNVQAHAGNGCGYGLQ